MPQATEQDEKQTLAEESSTSSIQDGKHTTADSSSAERDGKENEPAKSPLQIATEIANKHSSTLEKEEAEGQEGTKEEVEAKGESHSIASTDKEEPKPGAVKEPTAQEKALQVEQEKLEKTFQQSSRFQELTGKVKQLEPLAQRAQADLQWMRDNGVNEQELTETKTFLATLKKDPAAARQMLAPLIESLNQYVGEKLPQDLQEAVDGGKVTVDYAKEIAKGRMQGAHTQRQLQQTQEQQVAQARQDGLGAWVTSKKATDPDFDKKFNLVNDRFLLHWAQKPNATPQEVVALAERAYTEIAEQLKPFQPAPPARRLPQSNGSRIITEDEPKTPYERAMQIASKHK